SWSAITGRHRACRTCSITSTSWRPRSCRLGACPGTNPTWFPPGKSLPATAVCDTVGPSRSHRPPRERKASAMKSALATVALGLPAWLCAGPAARAAEPEWKVGLAQVKITPERPVFLAGYASRDRPYDKVTTDLWAKALALEDRDGHVAVLVTTDLIGLTT